VCVYIYIYISRITQFRTFMNTSCKNIYDVCTTCLYSFAYQGKRTTPSYKKRNNTQFIGSENSAKDIQSFCGCNLNDKIARMSNE